MLIEHSLLCVEYYRSFSMSLFTQVPVTCNTNNSVLVIDSQVPISRLVVGRLYVQNWTPRSSLLPCTNYTIYVLTS